MSNRRKNVMDIRELVNQLRSGSSDRQISRDMQIARETVRRYREWAQTAGLLNGPLQPVEELQRLVEQAMPVKPAPQTTSSVEPYRETVRQMVEVASCLDIRKAQRTLGYAPAFTPEEAVIDALDDAVRKGLLDADGSA